MPGSWSSGVTCGTLGDAGPPAHEDPVRGVTEATVHRTADTSNCLRPQIETRTKGKLMAGIMAHLAEFELDLLIERTREAPDESSWMRGRPSAAHQQEQARCSREGRGELRERRRGVEATPHHPSARPAVP